MGGKAQPRGNELDRVNTLGIEKRKLFGLLRRNSVGGGQASVGISSGGGVGGNTGSTNTMSYLPTGGGAMTGAIAFNNQSTVITSNSINITNPTGTYSTYINIAESGITNLTTITGAHDDGQFLILQYTGSSTVTIKGNGSGNIVNFGLTDYTLNNGDMIQYIFNSLFNFWFQCTSGLAGSLSRANTALSNLTNPTAVNQILNMGGNAIQNANFISFDTNSGTNSQVIDGIAGTGITYNVRNSEAHFLKCAGTEFMRISTASGILLSSLLDLSANSIQNVGQISFTNTNRKIENSSGLLYNVLSGESHLWQLNSTNIFGVDADNTNGDVGYCHFHQSHNYTSANSGAATLPANPVGFIIILRNGVEIKMPYYAL